MVFEAETGHIPIKGQGYRGKFGGSGWDGMWTDMSEIVRPTRDGIHGREFISTEVDIGGKPPFLQFDDQQKISTLPNPQLPFPFLCLFDALPLSLLQNREAWNILSEAARHLQTFAVIPIDAIVKLGLKGPHLIPLIQNSEVLADLKLEPRLLEIEGWDEKLYRDLKGHFPNSEIILRLPIESEELLSCYRAGVRTFHCIADYHGRSRDGAFMLELIRAAHQTFVQAKCREEVTLMGSGGMIAAEHVAKAILCGLDAVALDTALLVALQARFQGACTNRLESHFSLPDPLTVKWGEQRLKNLAGAWRDQLLEILGAMGLREVRRMRGEMGRALFQKELEREAFAEIEGYE